jgi:hypothetical protein
MAKADIFDRALPYYVVAIAVFFLRYRASADEVSVDADEIKSYWIFQPEADVRIQTLVNARLFNRAIEICEEAGLIEALLDEFGPPIYVRRGSMDLGSPRLSEDFSVWAHISKVRAVGAWLASDRFAQHW